MQEQSKACSKCGEVKPLSEFYRDKKFVDGRWRWCRICELAARKAYYSTPEGQEARRRNNALEHSKALRKAWTQTEHGRAILARNQLARYRKNPDPFRARATIRNDVQAGKIPPANTLVCECGQPAVHYHHHNGYAREHWRDVVPVCQQCHDKAHGR